MATGELPPPRTIVTSRQYEKDAKRLRSRGKDMARVVAIVDQIRNRESLNYRHREHSLVGDWLGHREFHVQADWSLIYRIDADAVYLARTDTHSDLFGNG